MEVTALTIYNLIVSLVLCRTIMEVTALTIYNLINSVSLKDIFASLASKGQSTDSESRRTWPEKKSHDSIII